MRDSTTLPGIVDRLESIQKILAGLGSEDIEYDGYKDDIQDVADMLVEVESELEDLAESTDTEIEWRDGE